MKRAMELSLNLIIIAALALIVLIVVIAIFTGNMSRIFGTISSTQNETGTASKESTWCLSSLTQKCSYDLKSCSEIREGANAAARLPSSSKDCGSGERRALAANAPVGQRLCCLKI
jgi:hypothetical protein